VRNLTAIRTILNQSDNKFIGVDKPHGRVTVEAGWQLNQTPQVYGNLDGGPYRYWALADQSQTEVEVPNIDSIAINRSLDQEAATCTIIMSNQLMYDNDEAPANSTDLGRPGYYGYGYGDSPDSSSLWGQAENSWNNVLVPNAMLRTYQGYGGYSEVSGKLVPDAISTALTNGNLVLTGVWLIDIVSMGTDGKMRLQCRDMAKLLIEQMIYPPLVPQRYYPPEWYRFEYENVPSTPNEENTPEQEPGPASLVYEDSSVERWLGASSTLGALAPNAFTDDETQLSMGHGWRYWDNDYAMDWWQATCSGDVNEVYISPAGAPPTGNYEVWISIYEDGAWQGTPTITYDGDDPGSNIQLYHADKTSLGTGIKFVKTAAVETTASVNIDADDGTWIKLDRTYDADKIRITMRSTWDSPWGPNTYRSAVGSIRARLTEVDPVTEESAVTPSYETIQKDGNIRDWLDPVKELLLWSGFLLYEGSDDSDPEWTGSPGVFGTLETSGTYPLDALNADLFDKKSVMDAIISIKEVLGYVFFIDEEGGVHFHSPNWWALGNTDENGDHSNYIHEIYDTQTLTDFTTSYTDQSVRSEIIIGSDLSVEAEGGTTQYVSFDPAAVQAPDAPDLNRGLVRPAIWINEVWTDEDEQRLMAALIALHSMFNSRQGSVTIVANPEIQINDQVRIYERVTSEAWSHYVRSVNSTMNLETGEYTMTLGTNWLGELEDWAFDRNILLALYNRQNQTRQTDYDNGYAAWRALQDVNTQDFQTIAASEPTRTHGEGGTWRVGVIGPPEPLNYKKPAEDLVDSDVRNFMDAVSTYAQVEIQYFFSTDTVPTDYEVIVITTEANNADINNWGSLADIGIPIIHARPANWDDGEITDAASTTVNATNIDAKTNAAFEIAGAPGTVTFGDGGTVNTEGVPNANMLTGYISVGESLSAGEIVIAAIPSGTTYQDTNTSSVKHVMWGTDIVDPEAYDQVVWEAFGDAILWTRN
jgi:hypothetical protein